MKKQTKEMIQTTIVYIMLLAIFIGLCVVLTKRNGGF